MTAGDIGTTASVVPARTFTAGSIPHDDPDAIAFLEGIGAEPEAILAPE
jgi:hypothetical protein